MELLGNLNYYAVGALGFIIAFGLAVFIHELGHFLAAKAFKVPVERFVIGFDKEALPFCPKCFFEKKVGETTYGLSWMPLGGYVKMAGVVHPDLEEYLDESPKEKEPTGDEEADAIELRKQKDHETFVEQAIADQTALYQKPFWQKTIIYGAGVTMNLVLAMAIVSIVAIRGESIDAPLPAVVGWMTEDSILAKYDIQQGDEIVKVNGLEISSDRDFWGEVNPLFESLTLDDDTSDTVTVGMELMRDGERITRRIPFNTQDQESMAQFASIISFPAYIDYVVINHPADKAGIEVGDTVVAINDEPIDDWNEMLHIVRGSLDEELTLVLTRDGEEFTTSLRTIESTEEDGVALIGVWRGNPEKEIVRATVSEAVTASPGVIIAQTKRYVNHLGLIGQRLLRLEIDKVRRDLGGPVAIAQMAGRHANLGFERFMQFMIMLNIALAVMNLLPLPILDGGHIILAAYEGLFGKPLPPKLLVPLMNGALIFFLCFFLLITFSDVLKLVMPAS